MPIRFRCAYCNQLMGIARRKAGNVVRCPTCAGQVIVPTPGASEPPQPGTAPQTAGALFEKSDFDQDLLRPPDGGKPSRRGAVSPKGLRDDAIDVEPVSVPLMMGTAAQESGLHLSTGTAVLLGVGGGGGGSWRFFWDWCWDGRLGARRTPLEPVRSARQARTCCGHVPLLRAPNRPKLSTFSWPPVP